MYDGAFFAHYDGVCEEIRSLSEVHTSHAAAKSELATAVVTLEETQKAATVNAEFIKEQTSRIDLVSTHWFFGTTALQPQLWLRGGAQGKIARAQAKLDKALLEKPKLMEAESKLADDEVPRLRAEVDRLASLAQRKVTLEKERDGSRDAAIAANPSERLTALADDVERLQLTVDETAAGADGLEAVGQLFGDAHDHFDSAKKLVADAAAAERDADAIFGAAAAAHAPPAFATEACEAAVERDRMRRAALDDLSGRSATLRTTIAETAACADFVRSLGTACAKARAQYKKAKGLGIEAAEAEREAFALMRPPEGAARYGAPPVPRHRQCGEEGGGEEGGGEEGGGTVQASGLPSCATTAERLAGLEHLRGEASQLRATMADTKAGAEALKGFGGLCSEARCVVLTRSSRPTPDPHPHPHVHACTVPPPNLHDHVRTPMPRRTRARALSRLVTVAARWRAAPCGRGHYQRAAVFEKEERAALHEAEPSIAAGDYLRNRFDRVRSDRVAAVRGQLAELTSQIDRATAEAEALSRVDDSCGAAHNHYLRALQLMRTAQSLNAGSAMFAAEGAAGGAAASGAESADDALAAKLRQVNEEGEKGAALLSEAVASIAPSVFERFPNQRSLCVGEVPTRSLSDLPAVQSCVAHCAATHAAVSGLVASMRRETEAAKAKRAPLEASMAAEERRARSASERELEESRGAQSFSKAFASLPPCVPLRYPSARAALMEVALPEALEEGVPLADALEGRARALEAEVRADGETAQSRLKPIDAAIKAEERRESKLAKALSEADKGDALLAKALATPPPCLAARVAAAPAVLASESAALGGMDEAERLSVIERVEGAVAAQEATAKAAEAALREEHDASRTELGPIETAMQREETRAAKLEEALKEADKATALMQQGYDGVPPSVPARYPERSRRLVGVCVPRLTQAIAQQTLIDFCRSSSEGEGKGKGDGAGGSTAGESAGGSNGLSASTLLCEWASGHRVQQSAALITHCGELARARRADVGALVRTLRADGKSASEELTQAQAAIPAERERIFGDLRVRAGA